MESIYEVEYNAYHEEVLCIKDEIQNFIDRTLEDSNIEEEYIDEEEEKEEEDNMQIGENNNF